MLVLAVHIWIKIYYKFISLQIEYTESGMNVDTNFCIAVWLRKNKMHLNAQNQNNNIKTILWICFIWINIAEYTTTHTRRTVKCSNENRSFPAYSKINFVLFLFNFIASMPPVIFPNHTDLHLKPSPLSQHINFKT